MKLYRHRETVKAVLMSVDDNRNNAVWLPKSFIAGMTPARGRRFQYVVTMSEWLATKNKLL